MRKYYLRLLKKAFHLSWHLADTIATGTGILLGVVGHFVPLVQKAMNELVWQMPLWTIAAIVAGRLIMAPYWLAQEDEKKRKIVGSEFETLKKSHESLIENQRPRIEIIALINGEHDAPTRWFLVVHNKSRTASLSDCLATIVNVETTDGTQVPSSLTLGTQNQWRDNTRTKGRFNLDPDGQKKIVICDPTGRLDEWYILFGPSESRKLQPGKYRINIKVAAKEGEPTRAVVLIDGGNIKLETSNE